MHVSFYCMFLYPACYAMLSYAINAFIRIHPRPCEAEARPSQLKKTRRRLAPRQMPRGLHVLCRSVPGKCRQFVCAMQTKQAVSGRPPPYASAPLLLTWPPKRFAPPSWRQRRSSSFPRPTRSHAHRCSRLRATRLCVSAVFVVNGKMKMLKTWK